MHAIGVKALDDLVLENRQAALTTMLVQRALAPVGHNFNLHCHSFFSYNADGWSPTRLAYECRQAGLNAAGLCDFDVLDGLEEFYDAAVKLGLRAVVHLETRAYVQELAAHDINSPGEAGVAYIMGCGFPRVPAPASVPGTFLSGLRQQAQARNLALIERINQAVPQIAIDYAAELLPLTPAGVATERHIVRAYRQKAALQFPTRQALATFWALLFQCDPAQCTALFDDIPKFEEHIRSALVKRGGLGYVPPTAKTFPAVAEFIAWVKACDAIPTIAWLDGTSRGEADSAALLDLMSDLGCAAINIIPERNWNLPYDASGDAKRANLAIMVKECQRRDFPINIGTEMNRQGLPPYDELMGPVLKDFAATFIQGMQIMVGHALLARFAAAPYLGERALAEFGNLKKRNQFYAAVGVLPAISTEVWQRLATLDHERAFAGLADAAKAGDWRHLA